MTAQKLLIDKRSSASLLILFLVLAFLGAVVFTLMRHRGAVRQEESIKAANAAKESFEAARDLVGLDDDEAKEKLVLGKESLDRAVRLGLGGRREAELEDLYDNVRLGILKIITVKPQTLRRFEKNSVSDLKFDYEQGVLVLLNSKDNRLEALSNLEDDNAQETVLAEDVPEDNNSLIVTESLVGSWGSGGFQVEGRSGGVGGSASFGELGRIEDVFGFANWIYVLSSDKDQIYKFYNTGKEFSSSPWLGADISVEEGSLLAINGDIYVWSETLYKFTKGRETDFYPRLDLETPLEVVQDIAVWPGCTFLYLLDSDNGRILQITKEGLLEAQFTSSALKKAKSVAVNSAETKAFVLTASEVLELPLN